MAKGYLIVNVYSDNIANPVKNATVIISKNQNIITTTTTNEDGSTEPIALETVNKQFSEQEQYEVKPYETYDITVTAISLTETTVNGVQIFDGITSIQNIYMTSIDENQGEDITNLPSNTLWDNYSPSVESFEKPNTNEITPYVLQQVVIPENIIVHDGIPTNSKAPDYTVPFIDYIKNVASSEIYSTWPKETIKANVLAIISFTLNRIFTEWYKSKDYDFTITSTTTYDQKYTRNGTIFEPISNIVDDIFNNYIRYGFKTEPLLAHYKNSTNEEGYLSQWGSKELGDKGYSSIEILRYYYGNAINIYEANVIEEYPFSFTKTLQEGDCSIEVYILQNALNYIRGSYPGIPIIENPTGYFDEATKKAVLKFQSVFYISQTGRVNYQTWYRLSYIYTAVSKLTNSIYS